MIARVLGEAEPVQEVNNKYDELTAAIREVLPGWANIPAAAVFGTTVGWGAHI
ncbi:hypothetical protein [Corynebacterium deserti]|uniref:hypothetical protein n=1 Tax=Corynebacterium deserti TaxID=1408191 RepID=UPI000AA99A0F|nr:hypothetical protein [Corynebacterium deserti]